MRVVAGSARGRRLVAPAGTATRPTSDRVRESVFNMLAGLGGVESASVLDLYAGSGALGIEALSRGAAHATFVEHDRRAVRAIRTNLETLGLAARAHVVTTTAERHLAGDSSRRTVADVVFVDPPYAFDEWARLLGAIGAVAADDAVVVCESDRAVTCPPGWLVERQRAYGSTVITIARRTAVDEEHP